MSVHRSWTRLGLVVALSRPPSVHEVDSLEERPLADRSSSAKRHAQVVPVSVGAHATLVN
jgi:hypothetical protein